MGVAEGTGDGRTGETARPLQPIFVSWARVEPRRGAYDEGELAAVRRSLGAAWREGAEPVVVAHSGALPDWQIARDGWMDPDALAAWGCFVDRLGGALTEQVRYAVGLWTPLAEARCYEGDARRVARVLLDAQAVAYLHLRRVPGRGARMSVGVAEESRGRIADRVLVEPFLRALATGRLGPPFAITGELPNGTPAADFVAVLGDAAGVRERLGIPVVTLAG
jgi:hypothetical protein